MNCTAFPIRSSFSWQMPFEKAIDCPAEQKEMRTLLDKDKVPINSHTYGFVFIYGFYPFLHCFCLFGGCHSMQSAFPVFELFCVAFLI